jgi:hypothetical protein
MMALGAAALAGCNGAIGGHEGVPTGTGAGTGSGNSPGAGTGNSVGSGSAGSGIGSGTGGTTGVISGTAGTSGVVTPPPPTTCTPGVPTTSQLPRLTRAEYDATTRDLLGIDVQPSSMLAPDTVGSVDQRAWDGFSTAADSLATQVMASATARAKVFPCTTDSAACVQQFITTFGAKAFRRQLTTAEVTRFQNLYTSRATLTATGTLDEALQLILKAFLLSPSFLTKAELSESTPSGSYYALNGYEMASRLSYMLWGTMPDDTLFSAAAAGQLSSASDILAQAQRMLQDPKARAKVADFHAHYALMGDATRWSEAAHDPTLFPAFKPSMVQTLSDEASKFFDYVTFDLKGTFQDLITKPVAFVNSDLAPIYGLPAANFGTDLQLTNLDQATRAGVFTHVGFLASYSSYNRTSPILRGAFLEKQVLCRQIGSPPPDAANTPVPTDATLVTNRQRVTQQTSPAACTGCHGTIVNPAGFALEAYDSIGASQTAEHDTGAAIDSTADVLIGANTVHVGGPTDLMGAIAASPEGQSCYAQRWVTYAYERDLTSQDLCTVQSLASNMTGQSGYTILNLITDLTQADSFRLRAKELP